MNSFLEISKIKGENFHSKIKRKKSNHLRVSLFRKDTRSLTSVKKIKKSLIASLLQRKTSRYLRKVKFTITEAHITVAEKPWLTSCSRVFDFKNFLVCKKTSSVIQPQKLWYLFCICSNNTIIFTRYSSP